MTDPHLLDVGERVAIPGPGFEASLVRLRDTSWVIAQGGAGTTRSLATVTSLGGDVWLVEPIDDPGVARRFETWDKALRFAVTR